MDRREFCRTLGIGGCLLSGAGCLTLGGPDGLRLGGLVFINRRDRPVEARLRISQNETQVFDESYSFPAHKTGSTDSGVTLTDAWEDMVAVYEVTVDVVSEASDSFEYTASHSDGDCTIAYVETREGTIYFGSHSATESIPCNSSTTAE